MPLNVGGDGSVIWKVRVNGAKHAKSDADHDGPAKEFFHEGVDEAAGKDKFTIKIKLDNQFPLEIVENPGQGNYLVLKLKIEPKNGSQGENAKDPDQIIIDW